MVAKCKEALRRNRGEVNELLDQLSASFVQTLEAPGMLPQDKHDLMCVICLKEGDEVLGPVRMPKCRGHHYLCAACARQHSMRTLRCPVCNI